ncbi:MAG: hypothetical protein E7441_00875 [Ruminococcaceae bacterium]|nr:hypothetical protein [Oscillospiraceae bacterium]
MNKNENGKNTELKPLGWLVIPDFLFNEGSDKTNWINLYYDNNLKIYKPNTSQKDKVSSESTETKRMSFGEKLKWVFSNK